jgi:predicted DNA-binding protein YlxM (UPF0122 family)
MEIVHKNEIIELMFFYEALLTKKQRDYLEAAYDEDFSLVEIAQQNGVSKQAVGTQINIAIEKLKELEQKMHLQRNFNARAKIESEIQAQANGQLSVLIDQLIKIEDGI